MKKYILVMIMGVVIVLGMMFWHKNKVNHYYENYEPYSKLVKEIVINTNDTDHITNRWCVYKKIKRIYNHGYCDSIQYHYFVGDSLLVIYYMNEIGDTISIEYSHRINNK